MSGQPESFVFSGITTRVVFGSGTLSQLAQEVERLGHKRALVLSTAPQAREAQALAQQLGPLCAGTFAGAVMHTPVEVTQQALAAYRESGADCIVSFGGGSTIGLGKAIAVRTGADQIAVPTTYAGSEMTDILGETENGEKVTRRDASIRPETVIYDVDTTLTLPPALTVTSAFNAIAHGIEGLYAPDGNPILSLMAVDAMTAFRRSLPKVVADPADTAARADVLYAAWLCSTVLGHVSMALHHKLAHVLGGSFNLPHADTHTILIPHVAAFNTPAAQDQLQPAAQIFGGSLGAGLWDFASSVGAPQRLKDLGLGEADLDRAAEIATRKSYQNPREFDMRDIRQILQDAWEGARPGH